MGGARLPLSPGTGSPATPIARARQAARAGLSTGGGCASHPGSRPAAARKQSGSALAWPRPHGHPRAVPRQRGAETGASPAAVVDTVSVALRTFRLWPGAEFLPGGY